MAKTNNGDNNEQTLVIKRKELKVYLLF